MKHIKKFNENLVLTEKERRKILIDRGLCPVCESILEESDEGEEDEYRYLVCPESSKHVHIYLGLVEDLEDQAEDDDDF